jgi:hypothetical protein
MTHPASLDDDRFLQGCAWQFLRRGGPGGQHRNKTETAAVLRHQATGITAEASERRSQAENRQQAVFRLRLALAIHCRQPVLPTDLPSGLWRQRCRSGKLAVATDHRDYPALLAEALDRLATNDFHLQETADQLQLSSTQLAKFLKSYRPAWDLLNSERDRRGWPRLR